jgi:hypothetical protein
VSPERPTLTVFSLRDGKYRRTAHVTGDAEYRAELPFAVTIVPSKLVAAQGRPLAAAHAIGRSKATLPAGSGSRFRRHQAAVSSPDQDNHEE